MLQARLPYSEALPIRSYSRLNHLCKWFSDFPGNVGVETLLMGMDGQMTDDNRVTLG
jgi:hypothetical protein